MPGRFRVFLTAAGRASWLIVKLLFLGMDGREGAMGTADTMLDRPSVKAVAALRMSISVLLDVFFDVNDSICSKAWSNVNE